MARKLCGCGRGALNAVVLALSFLGIVYGLALFVMAGVESAAMRQGKFDAEVEAPDDGGEEVLIARLRTAWLALMWASAAAWITAGSLGLCATTCGRSCGVCAAANGTCYTMAYALSVAMNVVLCLGLMAPAGDSSPSSTPLSLPATSAAAGFLLLSGLLVLQTACLVAVCAWCCAGVSVKCAGSGAASNDMGWASDEVGCPADNIPPTSTGRASSKRGIFRYKGGTIKPHQIFPGTTMSQQGTGGLTGRWQSAFSGASTLYGTATMSSGGGSLDEEAPEERGWSLQVRIPVAWPLGRRVAPLDAAATGGLVITRNGVVTYEEGNGEQEAGGSKPTRASTGWGG
mmetsp:Transcript_17902/g.45383  ORF Transcript_17902/g.45383 Transcript_17902/m.45383 type:complete len:344 (-) Transcript_17902:74-1105(-)